MYTPKRMGETHPFRQFKAYVTMKWLETATKDEVEEYLQSKPEGSDRLFEAILAMKEAKDGQ
tara:strand:- start:295 stop:480 length:186 start_codon:yes stop_codon:yes gene_type:complete